MVGHNSSLGRHCTQQTEVEKKQRIGWYEKTRVRTPSKTSSLPNLSHKKEDHGLAMRIQ